MNGSRLERLYQLFSPEKNTSPISRNILVALKGVRKILIFPNDHIGGVFVGLPAYNLIRCNYPDADIYMLATSRLAVLAQNISAIDKVIVGNWHLPIWKKSVKKLAAELCQHQFDLVFCMGQDCSFRLARLCWQSGADFRVGYQREVGAFNIEIIASTTITKEAGRYLHLVKMLGLGSSAPSTESQKIYDDGFCRFFNEVNENSYDIALDIANPNKKGLAKAQLVELVGRLINLGIRLVVFYQDDTNKTYLNLLKIYGAKIHFYSSANLAEIAPILGASRLLISCHTDILHLAIALGGTCLILSDEELARWIDLKSAHIKIVAASTISRITVNQIIAGVEALGKIDIHPT